MRRFTMSRATINLTLALLAALFLVGINETGFIQSNKALDDIAVASRIRGTLNRVLQLTLDAETGSRGYLLPATGIGSIGFQIEIRGRGDDKMDRFVRNET